MEIRARPKGLIFMQQKTRNRKESEGMKKNGKHGN